jgi:hypothetical protein
MFDNQNVTPGVSPLINGYLTQESTQTGFGVTFGVLPIDDAVPGERHQGGVTNSTDVKAARTPRPNLGICASLNQICLANMGHRMRATERYDITHVNESAKEECLRYKIARRRSRRLQQCRVQHYEQGPRPGCRLVSTRTRLR